MLEVEDIVRNRDNELSDEELFIKFAFKIGEPQLKDLILENVF